MAPTSESPADLAFGRFRISLQRRELLADARPIKLGGRAFDVLMALIEARGAVVSKDALMARVWPSRNVEENALESQIMAVRRAFGDDRRLIRTVSGRGYQFTGELHELFPRPTASVAAGGGILELPPTNIPEAVFELIGREEELGEILNLAAAHRLVTLTGAGGIGKTTLALALARELRPHSADGVWLVEFSNLADQDLVPAAVAAAVGLELGGGEASAPRVAQALAHRRLLLVLDTCEHVIDAAAAFVEAILRAGSALHIIATSREPLRAEGEWVYAVRPLAVPADDAADEPPLRYGAIRLFMERARAAGADLTPDRKLMTTIAAICRRLDGIPLAIELAAARVVALGVEELATRLDDRFGLLSGGRRHALPRHQTLRATIDWSHTLLVEAERVILRRLAVFAGAFGFQAASVVAASAETAPSQVIDGLSSLLTKSLVAADAGGGVRRYRLLDTTRAYALEKLTESGEREPLARRHAEYYRDLFEQAEAEWETRPAAEWLAEYGREIDNLRAALDWAFSHPGEVSVGVALAAAAVPLWMHLSLLEECGSRMADALDAFPPERLDTRQEMAVQLAFGYSIMITHRLSEKARAALERANALGKALGDLDYQLRALACLVVFSRMSADFSPALALSRQVDAIAQRIATPLALGTADCLLSSTLLWLGQYAEARTRAEAGSRQDDPQVRRAHRVRHGYDHWMNSRTILVQVLWAQGFSERALQLMQDVVAEAEQMLHPFTLAYALTTAGCLVPLWAGDLPTAEPRISRLKEHAGRHALGSYHAAGVGFEGLLHAARGDTTTAVRLIRTSITELRDAGFHLYATVLLSGLAGILANSGEIDGAMAAAEEAVTRAERGNNHWWLPEALRAKGEVALLTTPADSAMAEDFFGRAMNLARRQGALSWELRAATGLARVLRQKARPADAVALLKPVYDRFTEGFGTTDLMSAKALLDDLG